VGVLGAITVFGIVVGDWTALLYDADYLGNRCGQGVNAGKSKAFYPRIPVDMFQQQDVVASGNFWNLKLYAICVESCPTEFNLENPEASMIDDYGYVLESSTTQAIIGNCPLGMTCTKEQWLSATPTMEIVNRCLPRGEATQGEVAVCAYPKCDHADVIAAGGECANGDYANGEWHVCPTAAEVGSGNEPSAQECVAQRDVCQIRATTTTTTEYTIDANDEASAAMMASIANTVGGFYEVVSSISDAWVYILIGGIAMPIGFAFVYMLLLFFFAKAIIYTLLFILIVAELFATFVCFSRSGIAFDGVTGADLIGTALGSVNVTVPNAAASVLSAVDEDSRWLYAVAFIILAIVTVCTIIMVLSSRKKIRVVAAIVTEATTVFASQPFLMLFPSVSTFFQIGICIWFVATLVMIYTVKPESIANALAMAPNVSSPAFIAATAGQADVPTTAATLMADPLSTIRDLTENDNFLTIAGIITFVGFLVLMQWVQGIAWCTMSGSVYYWFFFRANPAEKTRAPITKSLGRTLFYHSGSVAFAAFVIAACDVLRAVAAYVEKQLGPTSNAMTKILFKCIQCCLSCLKKTVKFVSYYGLVWVACQGTSFCGGCFKTFFFFLQNPAQVSINALVTWLLRLIATLSMPLACGGIFFYILDSMEGSSNAIYPAAIIFIVAAFMTLSCMTVFECSITTIFVCCFQDKAEFDSKFMSDRLAKAFQIKRGDTLVTPDPNPEMKTQKL
jgi:choline transporter-like protein 2/4/5